MIIEIVVYNIESAVNAQKGGADRIELCDNPAEGGTTPSFGMLEQVLKKLSIQVFAMIRPRGGDFCYSADEVEVIKRDIEICKQLGVDGIVFGILDSNGRIDVSQCRTLINLARPLEATCHRAFDVTRDAFEALEDCMEAGFDRILTSGRQPSAPEGSVLIKELVRRAGNRIIIMPGSGINERNVHALVQETNATEIHFSAKKFIPSGKPRYNHLISFLDKLPDDSSKPVTDAEVIKAVRKVLAK